MAAVRLALEDGDDARVDDHLAKIITASALHDLIIVVDILVLTLVDHGARAVVTPRRQRSSSGRVS